MEQRKLRKIIFPKKLSGLALVDCRPISPHSDMFKALSVFAVSVHRQSHLQKNLLSSHQHRLSEPFKRISMCLPIKKLGSTQVRQKPDIPYLNT